MSCLWSAWAPEHVVVTSLQPELIHSPSTPPLKSLSGAALGLVMCDSQVELIGGLLPPASPVTGLIRG